ncbi:MAG: PAS domain S-box protein [Gammaproteobacteria bacterium]
MQSKIRDDSDALREFYSIALSKDLTFVDQAKEVLRLGCEYLGLHCGIISYVEGERYTILHVYTATDEYEIQGGDVFELGLTYCKFTLEQKKAIGFHHAALTDIAKHPSYEALKLESYLGAPTFLNDTLFGTVNFTSINPRAHEFTESEIYYAQLISEWISKELDRNYRQVPSYQQHVTLTSRLETSPLAIIEMTPAFEVTKWSDTAELILGWREEQVLNKAPKDWPVVGKDDLVNLISMLDNLQNCNDQGCAFSCDLRKNNGQLISTEWMLSCTFSEKEKCTKAQAHVLDITDRVNAENELLRKSALYLDLFQNAPDMYMSLDQTGNIISINNQCKNILGYEVVELIGTPFWSLIDKKDLRRIRRLIDVAFLGDVEELEMEANILKKDNSIIRAHQRIRIIQVGKGAPHELRIILRDITERTRGQIYRLDHMRHQRDEITTEVQHRIKNSLQAVIGMLTVSVDAHPDLKPILTNSIAQINTISIVNGLIMDGKQDVNVLNLLTNLFDASSKLFNCEIRLKQTSKDQAVQMLVADEVISVSLVITELLINALKHHAQNSNNEDYVSASVEIDDDEVNLSIINTFDQSIPSKEHESHLGLMMIDALLPPQGAVLQASNEHGVYAAKLTIKEPVIINGNNDTW